MTKEQLYEALPIEPSTKAILQRVEEETGKAFEFIEKPDLTVSASVKIARSFMSNHIVAFRSGNHKRLSHLIAHECGHIMRYYSVPAGKRVIPGTSKEDREKASYWIDRTGTKKLSKLPTSAIPRLKELWINGFIQLLTNLPVDYRIETWIYNDFPDFRAIQRASLDADYDTAVAGTSNRIEAITPDAIFKKVNTANCVFYTALDRRLGTSYASGFKKHCEHNLASRLLQSLMTADEGFEQDIRTINEWADILSVSTWFRWIDFEDVPGNYADAF